MKTIFVVFALLFSTSATFANDSAISGTSGSPGALKANLLAGEHSSVRMVREHIEMQIGRDDYITDAHFIFYNDGPATTVRMGFPEGAGGDSDFEEVKKKTAFKEFTTWVDGKRIRATRMASGKQETFSFDAYWVKSVRFARKQRRHIRVRYRSELGFVADRSSYVFYDFTGGNWKGKVAQSTLRLAFTFPGTYQLFPIEDVVPMPHRRDSNNEIFLQWRNWQAQSGFALRFQRTLPNTLIHAYEPKYLNQRDDLYAKTKTLVVKGTEHFNPWQAKAAAKPDALLRNGYAFIQFRVLHDHMRMNWEQKNKRTLGSEIGMYAHKGRFAAPIYDKANQNIYLEEGSKKLEIDERQFELPVAPFVSNGVLYVPMGSTVKALGGSAKVNTRTMRYWFHIPA
jgi:hypothetical protein